MVICRPTHSHVHAYLHNNDLRVSLLKTIVHRVMERGELEDHNDGTQNFQTSLFIAMR